MPKNFYKTPNEDRSAYQEKHLMKGKSKGVQCDPNSPAVKGVHHLRMSEWWATIEAILGGTTEIRLRGEQFLPKEPGESDDAYHRRLNRAVLAPWYKRLVRGLVGMVLRKPIKLNETDLQQGTVDVLKQHLTDVNLQGSNLQVFSRDIFESAVNYGYSGILVDYPITAGIVSRADEIQQGVRPYWVQFNAPDVLGMRWIQTGSQRRLSQIRLRQFVTVEDGLFGNAEIEQILVYELTEGGVSWFVYREEKTDDDELKWVLFNSGQISLSEIPFAFCYTDKRDRIDTEPPMLDIAHLNIKHYQLEADLDHALHVASVPRQFIFGATPETIGDFTTIDEVVCIPNADARAEWSSAKFDSFQSLQSRITAVEDQMGVLGVATLTTPKNVGESAEAKRLDRTQSDSVMSVIAQSLQNALDQCLMFHLQYLGINEQATCTVNRDFDLSQLDSQMITALHNIRQGGSLSLETFLNLLQQAEIGFPEDWTVDSEIERIDAAKSKDAQTVLPDINETDGMLPGKSNLITQNNQISQN